MENYGNVYIKDDQVLGHHKKIKNYGHDYTTYLVIIRIKKYGHDYINDDQVLGHHTNKKTMGMTTPSTWSS